MVARGQSEHHAGQPLSGLSCTSDEGIGTRMFNAVMVVYVRFVQSVSNVFVFDFGVATAVFPEVVDLLFPPLTLYFPRSC
jgi:hypothetical protein